MRREIAKELVAASKKLMEALSFEGIGTTAQMRVKALEKATNAAEEYLKESFFITSVSKDDIRAAIGDGISKEEEDRIRLMDDDEMESLAEDMTDDYVSQLYWISLKTIFKDKYMGE